MSSHAEDSKDQLTDSELNNVSGGAFINVGGKKGKEKEKPPYTTKPIDIKQNLSGSDESAT